MHSLVDLADWIKRFQQNRHIAAHGAFYPSAENGSLKVLYTHQFKDHGVTKFRAEETEIKRNLVLELIADADRILRIIAGLDTKIQKGEILTHPFSTPK